MIRSLYVRVVFIFLMAVIVGLAIAFIATSTIFEKQLAKEVRDETTLVANDLIDTYINSTNQDINSLRNNVRALRYYSIRIVGTSGDIVALHARNSTTAITATPQQIAQVLNGETIIFDEGVIGQPFMIKGEIYALFIMPVFTDLITLPKVLITFLLIIFSAGSLIFLIASRFLIKPIRTMTAATEKMSRGDFEVALNLSRKDELGTLAQSFDRMAKELKQIEQMRQDFVSNVSHEMQSPLTSITGFAKALRDGVVSSENNARYLDIIAEESERLSRLSDNLLQLASLESKYHPLELKTFALDEQIRKIVVALEPQWSEKGITIELELPIINTTADYDQLSQVWTNLLGNAIKFTPEAGTIYINMSSIKDGIIVTIVDTGIGIPMENMEHVFERFYKADPSRNRSRTGSGLGLAIAKKIIELHSGRIQVSSTLGKGTTFEVILPNAIMPE
ncbi:HAMP domain-containing protein [Paenibacillus sp. GSMTC-2017]|uniref:sensor histidine kinase n=1 Tax=Paenibacillus sp. GSMTC-2017 TaxID=2794350 RepID=UPI0018D6BCBC|nr:HAMP domain-containing sensor histidine kinase [Paenibacillus sp. GSMTC-2017]MBH5317166.1 HAMP domain-containing protein [Paenibacillus sp. GSMTC-2017]